MTQAHKYLQRIITDDHAQEIWEHLRDNSHGNASYFWGEFQKCPAHIPDGQCIVYSKKINVPSKAFPSIIRRRLALNDIGKEEDSFIRLGFELQDGDVIQVVRQATGTLTNKPWVEEDVVKLISEGFDRGYRVGFLEGQKDGMDNKKLKASEALKNALEPLKTVHEKFKHFDKCLSDTEWCEAGEGGAIYGVAGEMWRAIKETLQCKDHKKITGDD